MKSDNTSGRVKVNLHEKKSNKRLLVLIIGLISGLLTVSVCARHMTAFAGENRSDKQKQPAGDWLKHKVEVRSDWNAMARESVSGPVSYKNETNSKVSVSFHAYVDKHGKRHKLNQLVIVHPGVESELTIYHPDQKTLEKVIASEVEFTVYTGDWYLEGAWRRWTGKFDPLKDRMVLTAEKRTIERINPDGCKNIDIKLNGLFLLNSKRANPKRK